MEPEKVDKGLLHLGHIPICWLPRNSLLEDAGTAQPQGVVGGGGGSFQQLHSLYPSQHLPVQDLALPWGLPFLPSDQLLSLSLSLCHLGRSL